MSKYLVGLQTIQTGASQQGGVVTKFQLGSHLLRKGNSDERKEVIQKRLNRVSPEEADVEGDAFGGNTMSMMVAGVMEASMSVSEFLDALWIQNALIAYRSKMELTEEEVFQGAFEISTPKENAAALNLLLYFHQTEMQKMERIATSIETRLLPGLNEMALEGIAFAGQILPVERVKKRITADREYLYGRNDAWSVYALKIRFPKSNDFDGYKNGGPCLGIHLDDFSTLSLDRTVKLISKTHLVGLQDVERTVFHEKVFENRSDLEGYFASLTAPDQRQLANIVRDVNDVLNVGTIYDRKLARSRDFWKKIKGSGNSVED